MQLVYTAWNAFDKVHLILPNPVSADMNTVRALMSLKRSVLSQNSLDAWSYSFVLNLFSRHCVDPDHMQKLDQV